MWKCEENAKYISMRPQIECVIIFAWLAFFVRCFFRRICPRPLNLLVVFVFLTQGGEYIVARERGS